MSMKWAKIYDPNNKSKTAIAEIKQIRASGGKPFHPSTCTDFEKFKLYKIKTTDDGPTLLWCIAALGGK